MKLNNGQGFFYRSGIMIGKIIKNRYIVSEKVAVGSQSDVYIASDMFLNYKIKVIKFIKMSQLELANFHEFNILTKIYSTAMPNITDVHFGEMNSIAIIMDFVEGIRLDKYVISLKRPDRICAFRNSLCQLSHLLFELHSHKLGSIIHCDLKPDNIIVSDNLTFKLLDFGIAVADGIDNSPYGIGNIHFSSPDLYFNHMITAKNDLYSLGCILFYIISGGKIVTSSNLRKSDWSIGLFPFEINLIVKLIDSHNESYEVLKDLILEVRLHKLKII
jgi:serine/threonine protein kinase